jgi:asparagine synthase (glutamine-hydrolysing)
MSMAHSLELRAPFLDYNLVEYMLSVDENLKRGNTNKYLLKQVAEKYLPLEIVHRQKKGFSSPFIEWTIDYYKDQCLNIILEVNDNLHLFNKDFILFLYNQAKKRNLNSIFGIYLSFLSGLKRFIYDLV